MNRNLGANRQSGMVWIVLATLCAVVAFPNAANAQGLRDKLRNAGDKIKAVARDTTSDVKQRVEESAKRCADCGAVIHFGDRCPSCLAKAAKVKAADAAAAVKRAEDGVREKWRDSAPERKALGEKLHAAPERIKEAAGAAAQKGREVWQSTAAARRDLAQELREATAKARTTGAEIYKNRDEITRRVNDGSREMWDRSREAAREYVPRIEAVIRDPEVQRQAIETIGTALALHKQLQDTERQFIYAELKTVGSIQIRTLEGPMTIEDACVRRFVSRFPQLADSDIARDPALVMTAVVMKDRDYFLRDMKIVPTSTGSLSVVEAIDRTTPFGASRTLAYLDVLQATEDMQTAAQSGEGSVEAIKNLVVAVNEVRQIEGR